MNPNDLTLYESPFNKIRIGKSYDGGYIINEIPNLDYGLLLSGGIAEDISFEEDFCYKYNTSCLAFDGTINKVNTTNVDINYIKKNIGINNSDSETNLFDIIDKYDNIFLKMDIEGHELEWIKILTSEQLNKFSQMVIEFHFAFEYENIFDKINKTHYLLHFHANNCCHPLVNHKGVNLPKVFECTFVNKKHINKKLNLNKENLPTKLDMPNIANGPDFYFNYKPFVN
jgi:hypothetical protein